MVTTKAPEEIACGDGCTWTFRKSGYTHWHKSSWESGTEAEKLVEDFSKATETAATDWVKAVKCTGHCPGEAKCSKGTIRIGPPEANGDRNTWPPTYGRNYEYCCIFVEVACRAIVLCYCGEDRPHMKEGSTQL